jgi:Ca2+-binding EF-hand superfamily protein
MAYQTNHTFDAHDFHELVHSAHEDQIKTLVDKIFAEVDGDGSGTWELPEVLSMLKQIAYHYAIKGNTKEPTEEHVHNTALRIFAVMDENNDGRVSTEEFYHYVIRQREMYKETKL